nr:tubulin beta-9 chain [Quercus suber]
MHRALLESVGASGSTGPEAVCCCRKECGFMDGKSWFQESICNALNIPCFSCPFNILLFWEVVCTEHSINSTGRYCSDSKLQLERVNVYYNEASSGKFVSCAVLIGLGAWDHRQLEVQSLCQIFRPNNFIFGQSGARNNWVKGHYTAGVELIDSVLHIVRKEAKIVTAFKGFLLKDGERNNEITGERKKILHPCVQIGEELMDFIIVLHDSKAVKTFCSHMHFSLGAGYRVATGPVRRVLEADLRVGDRGSGMRYIHTIVAKEIKECVDPESNRILAKFENNGRIPITTVSEA